ncbi:hypothetical protein FACS189472_08290 [Alphaproteobacteria bacterium]|nr:hypothetical protein FACS189472_08290 [Alphaproteobacteria bacterium]
MNGLLKPSSDFVFANLFGEEKHKRVLVCLLNSILKGKPTIKSITLMNPQHKKQRKNGRSATLDIKAVTDNKTIVDIEIVCSGSVEEAIAFARNCGFRDGLIPSPQASG